MQPISIVVAGTGFWGTEWLRVVCGADGVSLAATAGHGEPEVPESLPLAPGYRHYTDYREAIEQSDADALLITLPMRLHADAIQCGLDAGLHVLCEKPLAVDAEETGRLLTAAAARPDRVVMVSQNYRWRPWAQAVRAVIEDGTIGAIAHIGLRFSQPEFLAGARLELANPLLQDMAIHHFDLLRFLAGANASELYARQHTPVWNKYPGSPGLDMVITMDNDVQVSYSGTWAGRGGTTLWDGDFVIQGELGLLTVVDGRLVLHPDSGEVDLTGKGSVPTPDPVAIEVPEATLGDTRASFEEFLRAIDQGAEPVTSIRDNRHSIAMVFAAEESIRSGRSVTVASWPEADASTSDSRHPQGATTR